MVTNMKKILYVTIFITILLVSFIGITYSYEYNGIETLDFQLIGPTLLYVDVNTEYKEYGIKVIKNGVDISSYVRIDSSSVDINKMGEYKVKYEIEVDGNKEYVYREVIVIDKTSPQIKLKGDKEVYVMLGGKYYEDGYTVIDNYDTNLDGEVIISGSVDTNKVGEYELEYSVVDSSGNKGLVTRKVIVKEPKITLADISGNRFSLNTYDVTKYTNTVVKNIWTSTGIYYEVYVKDSSDIYKIKLKNIDNSLEYLYNMAIMKDNYFKGNLDLTLVPNGEYLVYVVGKNEDKLLNKLDGLSRLIRAKIGNKLVSISYKDDSLSIIIDDFKYEYDILIDPGHGYSDIGASNGLINEKEMNLRQSLYEKCRYESMGFKVYMTRYDDSYGVMLGADSLDNLQRRALAIGYYGTVSRLTYSNHHNASVRSGDSGFEILVSNKLSLEDLVLETSLYNKYKSYYDINDNSLRLYSRDYVTGNIYNKLNGNIYSYMDYYAVIRIPNELFNVKTVIYEPIYMSNSNDFSWYWINKNWIEVSEIKIEEYVNYLGGEYIRDNSKCL